MTNHNPLMNFGKYRGEPVAEVTARDPSYIDWCMAQDNLRRRLEPIINIIQVTPADDQETPEHNILQAKYFDPELIHNLIVNNVPRELYPSRYHHSHNRPFLPPTTVYVEREGWDVFAEWQEDIGSVGCGIELKPSIGDDYPSVLRQINKYPSPRLKMCVYQKYNGCVPIATVKQMFVASGIHLCGDISATSNILAPAICSN